MDEHKNIFQIGRRRNEQDEDQLTEMLAYLWQEQPELRDRWLEHLGITADPLMIEVMTQFPLPSGKRPDIAIFQDRLMVLVESKLRSGFGGTQINDYLEFLEGLRGKRALVLLTQKPETVPPAQTERARVSAIELISWRWQDMSLFIGEAGDGSLGGDFVQLLIREGLVKPPGFDANDWSTWNAGYNVLLRAETFLDELEPIVKRIHPSATKSANGLSKRWIYKAWRGELLEIGLGLGAARSDRDPHSYPILFAFVGNPSATADEAMIAVGATKGSRNKWTDRPEFGSNASCGLVRNWASIATRAQDILVGESFEEQLSQAGEFMLETARYFKSRGYLSASLRL